MYLEGTPPDAPASILRGGATVGRCSRAPAPTQSLVGLRPPPNGIPVTCHHQQGWRTQRKGSVRKLVRNPEAFAGCADSDPNEPGRYRQSPDRRVKCGFRG